MKPVCNNAGKALNKADEVLSNHGIGRSIIRPLSFTSPDETLELAASKQDALSSKNKNDSSDLVFDEHSQKYNCEPPLRDVSSFDCCIHIHLPGTPPPDGKCCYHRCRPTWTREQRAKNYGEWELLSQPNNRNPNAVLPGTKDG